MLFIYRVMVGTDMRKFLKQVRIAAFVRMNFCQYHTPFEHIIPFLGLTNVCYQYAHSKHIHVFQTIDFLRKFFPQFCVVFHPSA